MAKILDFTCRDFNVNIMKMFKELQKITLKEIEKSMVLIKEYLQWNGNHKNLAYGNSQNENFNNWIEIFNVRAWSILHITEESVTLKADL